MPFPQRKGSGGSVSVIIAVPLASEVLPDILSGKLWKTWPRKNGFKQFSVPPSVPQTRAAHMRGLCLWSTYGQQGECLSPLGRFLCFLLTSCSHVIAAMCHHSIWRRWIHSQASWILAIRNVPSQPCWSCHGHCSPKWL